MGWFEELKEKRKQKKEDKQKLDAAISKTRARVQQLAINLNTPVSPEVRDAWVEEYKEQTTALERLEKIRKQDKEGITWWIRAIVWFILSLILGILIMWIPAMENKPFNTAKRLLTNMILKF